MNTVKDNYELHILSKAINNCIDQTLPVEANKALHLILYQNDDLVWEISTSIFRISGHKVDFSLVRDLVNSRIESFELDAVELAMAIEEEFDIEEIPYNISLCNIRNLLNFICSNLEICT